MKETPPGRPEAKLDAGAASKYASGVIALLNSGRLEEAEALARRLCSAYPTWGYANIMRRLFDRLPAADQGQLAFVDDASKEIQVARRDRAAAVLLVFCGFDHKLGLPLSIIHRWLGKLPASVVYLRDFRQLFFIGGLPSLGEGQDAAVAGLRDLCATLGPRIVCCGCSGGLFGALHYGLGLGAEAVLGLAGPTNLSAEFNAPLRSARRVAQLQKEMPGLPQIDLRQAYAATEHPPRVLISYDPNNWDDRIHAEHMAGLPSVALDPVEGPGVHAVIAELIVRDQFEARLNWLLGL